jgi:hypothetical protein
MFVVVMTTSKSPTRLQDHIKDLLPRAHGHQLKSIATFVASILEKQIGNQAELARTQGNTDSLNPTDLIPRTQHLLGTHAPSRARRPLPV